MTLHWEIIFLLVTIPIYLIGMAAVILSQIPIRYRPLVHVSTDGNIHSGTEIRLKLFPTGIIYSGLFLHALALIIRGLRAGHFPEWDSTQYCGLSLVGNIQAALFYPHIWLVFAVNAGRRAISYGSLQAMVLAHVWLAFLLCYVWLRHKKLAELPSALGAGVFALSAPELEALHVPQGERGLLRPYHDLKDIGRNWLGNPSLTLIYSSTYTCPDINANPTHRRHLEQYKDIMLQRRETLKGANEWWHLHRPRDENIWRSPKV